MKPAFVFVLLFFVFGVAAARADAVNRWSFNQPAGAVTHGTTMADSIGGATATVVGVNASFTGTALTLPGSGAAPTAAASAIAAYIDLPNGIISNKTHLTVEIWATPVSANGPRTARIMNGNQVISPTAAASTAITASRCSGPTLRCTTAATIAMIVTVNAV